MKIIKYKDELEQIKPSKASGGKIDAIKPDRWTNGNWIAETKLDGVRLLMHMTREGNRLTTRRISKKTNKYMERSNNVPHLRDLNMAGYEGTVIDGEGIAPVKKRTMKATQSIIGSSPEVAWEKQKKIGLLNYVVFDILRHKGKDVTKLPYRERRELLKVVLDGLKLKNGETRITLSEHYTEGKRELYEKIIHSGGEGIMLKNMNAAYYDSHFMEKVKKSIRWTMIISGYKPGKGKNKGKVGSIGVVFYRKTLIVYAGGMDDETRDQITAQQKDYIGVVVEIEGQELTEDGSVRHPRFIDFRIDKNPEDATIDQNVIIR